MAGSFLSCAACLRRTVRVAAHGSLAADLITTRALAALGQPTRHYATAAAAAPVDAPQALDPEPADAEAELDIAMKRERAKLQRIVKKHLTYMDDPWKIGHHVEQTLAKDRFDEALLLTQTASRDRQVVVAWNHLIAYQLDKQKLKSAIKLYHDMKKRGQLPNVRTFTIIFRGCAGSQHPKAAVAEAVKHYNVLLNDRRLQPNSIHLNAVLNVCAKAGDMDSLFLIANTVNDSTRAPTSFTYTILFNALRYHCLMGIKELPPEQQEANLQKTIDRAKALWAEVMEKYNQGRLLIDETLVCSLGRLLLLAPNREDKREVLNLLQQAMNIPNLTRPLALDPFKDPGMRDIALADSPNSPPNPPANPKAVYAVPGQNTLALVLTALASSRQTTIGIKYWNLLVRHYGIIPDHDNWLRMFGMLKVAKASAHAADILDILPSKLADARPYRVAMETCVRDNINRNAVENSSKILRSMLKRFDVPDLHTLRLYLRVALVSHYQFRAMAQKGQEVSAKRAYGVQINGALTQLWGPYRKAYYHYFEHTNAPDDDDKAKANLYNSKREVIALGRLMFSAANKVINEGMLKESYLVQLRKEGARINRGIQAFYSARETVEPNLRSAGEELEKMGSRLGGDFVWDTTKFPPRVPSSKVRDTVAKRFHRSPLDAYM
ncbi:PPR repeat family protein [Hirsutella rhossiliensis]|uniref:PPR repeat family domain-containing protein n=1 Tax=Hirsutella rhossiliensis TaxID=111463 RepID=A0A9P8MT24_9HYPO|nr:PPR repeat family domain-containing protein [Hirsutella rhossiliensis]KAH0960562.1 PPR repeat family domain-containing protein [Hirsutella rhossiliensis]